MSFTDSEHRIKKIFDEHFYNLLFFAKRYVNDYQQAQDIVQDIFVKVWQNIDDLKQVEDLKAYLFKAVKNSSLNYQRSLKVKLKFNADSENNNQLFEKSAEELCLETETQNRIYQVVNKLPEPWREAFILSKYNNLKYHEIALEMKISQKTVEKYISKALKFLREELKDLLLLGILAFEFFIEK